MVASERIDINHINSVDNACPTVPEFFLHILFTGSAEAEVVKVYHFYGCVE